MIRNTIAAYGSVAKFFHWIIFVLVFVMIVFGYFLEDIPKEYQGLAYNTHKLTGLTILSLMILRLLWTLINPKPSSPPGSFAWQRTLENVVHYSLYIVIIAMPLAGWIGSVAAKRPPRLGDYLLNLPIGENKALSGFAFDIHNTLAIVIIVLVSLHVLAALYHHFIKRDNILTRMLP